MEDKNKHCNQNQKSLKVDGDCSLNRFPLSTSLKNSDQKNLKPTNLSIIERLEKTNAIWIQPDLTRNDVDKVLQQFEVGIFIVRVNSDKKTMVLSYGTNDNVQHIRIKNDLGKGFYMDGSHITFESVNEMISHYMTHSIQSSDLFLKLPRALQEAYDTNHFKFFEKLKAEFWKTSLPNKSINEIFLNSLGVVSKEPFTYSVYNEVSDNESPPPLPLREYDNDDLSYNISSAHEVNPDKRIWKCPIWGCPIWKCGSLSYADIQIAHHSDKDYSVMSDKKSNVI